MMLNVVVATDKSSILCWGLSWDNELLTLLQGTSKMHIWHKNIPHAAGFSMAPNKHYYVNR